MRPDVLLHDRGLLTDMRVYIYTICCRAIKHSFLLLVSYPPEAKETLPRRQNCTVCSLEDRQGLATTMGGIPKGGTGISSSPDCCNLMNRVYIRRLRHSYLYVETFSETVGATGFTTLNTTVNILAKIIRYPTTGLSFPIVSGTGILNSIRRRPISFIFPILRMPRRC